MKNVSFTLLLNLFFILSGFGQTDNQLGLHSEGGPWQFYPAKVNNDSLPNVLLIGDSVMNGFHQSVIDSLKNIANVDYWLTPKHLNSENLYSDLEKVVSYKKYDAIQFNIGLHGWPEGRIKENEYVPLLEKYVETVKRNAQNAKLVWASITPVTEQDIPELNKEINPTIVRRNGLANQVMKKNNIQINDLYSLLENKLYLAKLDRFHWKSEGYILMANQSIEYILKGLKENSLPTYSDYNVIWDSLSINSLESMPAGNGDIGINLWVEKNGDLQFYISKTDAWSENARLLKIGKVRLTLFPNPFIEKNPFIQELKVDEGIIHIQAGKSGEEISIEVWVDANNPVIELDVKSEQPITALIKTEPWRTEKRQLSDETEIHSAYGLTGDGAPKIFIEKDYVLEDKSDGIYWLHHNKSSIWKENLELQALGKYTKRNQDPLLNRAFGALIRSSELTKSDHYTLQSNKEVTQFSVSIYAKTEIVKNIEDWTAQIQSIAKSTENLPREKRLIEHKQWWQSFWNRSFIHVSSSQDRDRIFNVSKNYALQRYMNACSGRGESPIKFNGSIFTVDTKNLENRYGGFDADYRQWGGPYWWQNTRLAYWSMLEAGDFDLMKSLFKMYKDALPLRKLATKEYYNHDGAFFPETMYFWGAYAGSNYGWDRSELPVGMTKNLFIRYYWQSGLEISLIMLDYYQFTKDEDFKKETLLPFVSEIITFYDQHWGRDNNGKILFDPAMALETYNTAVNPLPEIVGINKVCTELLRLSSDGIPKSKLDQWRRLKSELPDVPTRFLDGKKVLSPADEFSGKQNIENPELYAIFPYRAYGVGKEDLEMARFTFENRAIKHTGGWQQNAIKAALLGLTEEAAELTAQNFNASTTYYRFPTMWGPNYDWTPDQCHGTVAMTSLQRMMVQYDEDRIFLLPAWPKVWDAEFKLNAPQNTTIEGRIKDGKLYDLIVTPQSRMNDITFGEDYLQP